MPRPPRMHNTVSANRFFSVYHRFCRVQFDRTSACGRFTGPSREILSGRQPQIGSNPRIRQSLLQTPCAVGKRQKSSSCAEATGGEEGENTWGLLGMDRVPTGEQPSEQEQQRLPSQAPPPTTAKIEQMKCKLAEYQAKLDSLKQARQKSDHNDPRSQLSSSAASSRSINIRRYFLNGLSGMHNMRKEKSLGVRRKKPGDSGSRLRTHKFTTPTTYSHPLKPENEACTVSSVRAIMRKVPSPVVVVLASVPGFEHDGSKHTANTSWQNPSVEDCVAMTVSSFTTVSLDPEAVVSFNIKTPSRSWDAIRSSLQFRVCFLNNSVRQARLADVFSKMATKEELREALSRQHHTVYWPTGPDDEDGTVPLLAYRGGNCSNLICTLIPEKTVTVGDHIVLFAVVKSANLPGSLIRDFRGLMYQDGKYSCRQ